MLDIPGLAMSHYRIEVSAQQAVSTYTYIPCHSSEWICVTLNDINQPVWYPFRLCDTSAIWHMDVFLFCKMERLSMGNICYIFISVLVVHVCTMHLSMMLSKCWRYFLDGKYTKTYCQLYLVLMWVQGCAGASDANWANPTMMQTFSRFHLLLVLPIWIVLFVPSSIPSRHCLGPELLNLVIL